MRVNTQIRTYFAIDMDMLKGSKLEQKLVLKMGQATFRNTCNYDVAAFEGLGLEVQHENDRRRARASSDPLPHLAPTLLIIEVSGSGFRTVWCCQS